MTIEPTVRRFAAGDTIAPLDLADIRGEPVAVPDPDALVHLQFRRFAACPICNVHLRRFTLRHDELVGAGIREVVVFHSSVEEMRPHQGELPFAAVADPTQELYQEFGVEFSRRAVLNPKAWGTPVHPYAWRVGARELRASRGRIRARTMLGHPAEFLLRQDGRVLAAKYGEHANDQWKVDDVLALANGWHDRKGGHQ